MTTITQEQFEALWNMYMTHDGDSRQSMKSVLSALGITITPPAPPEAMVKLAQEIALREVPDWPAIQHPLGRVALAALQHAVKVVRDAPRYTDSKTGDEYAYLPRILKQLGAAQ